MRKIKKRTSVFIVLAALLVCVMGMTALAGETTARGINGKCKMVGKATLVDSNTAYIFQTTFYNQTASRRYVEAYMKVYNDDHTLYTTKSSCNNTSGNGTRSPAASRVKSSKYAKMSGILHSGTSVSSGEIDHVNLAKISK